MLGAECRELEKLSPAFCQRVMQAGRNDDGGGLHLSVKPDGRKTWAPRFRDRVAGKQRDMGLGPYGTRDVTLAETRDKAAGLLRALDGGRR